MPTTLIRRVEVIWSGLPGAPFYSQFFFSHQAGAATATAANVRTFLNALSTNLCTPMTAQIQPEQAIIDVVTAQPVNVEIATNQAVVNYTGTGDPLPWSTQVLLQLKTATFNSGRRLRGRIYIPGILESMCTAGELAPASQTTFNTPAQTLITQSNATGDWAVWSKRYQSWANVASATAWNQFGIQRRRRP